MFFSLLFLDSNDDIEANLDSDVELEDKNRQKSGKSNVCTCTVCLLEENQFMAVGLFEPLNVTIQKKATKLYCLLVLLENS